MKTAYRFREEIKSRLESFFDEVDDGQIATTREELLEELTTLILSIVYEQLEEEGSEDDLDELS